MATGTSSPTGHHYVDIHPVLLHDDHDGRRSKLGKQPNSPVKLRGGDRKPRINRQVSLGTGVAVFGMEKERRNSNGGGNKREGPRSLSRSGKSLGGLGVGGDAVSRKGDFSIFRTKSTINKQNSMLPLRKESELIPQETEVGDDRINQSVPAGRYFAALRGPELDQVRDYEDILLPKDEVWPFLLRFPIGCFGICLGLGSQAILWGALASSPAMSFLHVSPVINLSLWLLALAMLVSVSVTYACKCAFYFEAVRREYFHPVRVNFFFAPWIACMFLAIGAPRRFSPKQLHPAIWCVFVAPVFLLELKIYGQWFSGGKRRLCKVGNPSSHLSVVGNFVGAILAAKVGWEEAGKFLWAVGLAHYLVVFVTLYQRLPTSEALPKELHPVYSMFIATPSAASIAWYTIYGTFDAVARSFYFIALFLYISLVVRINFFRGFKFSVAWWSYTFPMTTASLATIKYAESVPCFLSKGLALSLSLMSSTMVSVLFVSTLLHAFLWKSLFPNDLAIAITKKKTNTGVKSSQGQEKKVAKKTYDIKRWAKQTPLSLVSSITKSSSAEKDSDGK
ncbi:guard cell S-type anion channel SLAC1 [Typha angustifolia]|uniref:guard cell S-type anion channel SLAC1 n=1 Tax=Typha angustifolia TaxID=59011 RepID=UPI003C2C8D03